MFFFFFFSGKGVTLPPPSFPIIYKVWKIFPLPFFFYKLKFRISLFFFFFFLHEQKLEIEMLKKELHNCEEKNKKLEIESKDVKESEVQN